MTPKRLKSARLKIRLTQHELADKLNLSRRMLQNYEAGRFPIPRTFEYAVYWLMVTERLKKVLLTKFFD